MHMAWWIERTKRYITSRFNANNLGDVISNALILTSWIPPILAFYKNAKAKLRNPLSLASCRAKSAVYMCYISLYMIHTNKSLSIRSSSNICLSIWERKFFFYLLFVFCLKTAVFKRLKKKKQISHSKISNDIRLRSVYFSNLIAKLRKFFLLTSFITYW